MKRLISFLLILALIAPGAALPARADAPATDGITLNFQNTDIDLVLKFLSDVTGRIFIKSDLIHGFITLSAPGRVSPAEALDILENVLEVKGFTLVPGPGKMIRILSQAEAAQTDLDVGYGSKDVGGSGGDHMMTQVVPLRFVAVADIKAELSPLLSKAGSLITDERTNSIIITDMASNIRRLLKMIDGLDVRTPQVLIEALVMEVSLTRETKLGIEWGDTDGFHGGAHGFTGSVSQGFDVASTITQGLKYSVIRDDGKLQLLLQALATDQNVNILSTPHIMTVNNQTAVIRVGEEVPVLTQTRNVQGGDTIRSFDYKSVAVELEVTPRINVDREVFLKVHPTVKKILGFNAELNAPILADREAQTAVIVKDGQTVVIGGLMKDDKSESQSKIPILGDIPLLGTLFRSRDTTNEKTELLVFITPRVVDSDDEARELTIRKESESKSGQTPYRMDAREHYRLGRIYFSEKKYAEAIQEWRSTVQLSPDERLKKKALGLIEKARKKAGLPS